MYPFHRSEVVTAVEWAVTEHLGRSWSSESFRDLDDRASHPCGIFAGNGFSVFAKFSDAVDGADQFGLEVAGLRLLLERGGVRAAIPVGLGVVETEAGSVLLLEGLTERAPQDQRLRIGGRSDERWRRCTA